MTEAIRAPSRPARVAALGVITTLAASVAAWALTDADHASLSQRFTPEHVDFMLMIDSAPQRRAHLVALLTTALACALATFFRGRKVWFSRAESESRWRSFGRWLFGALVAVGLCLIVDAPLGAVIISGPLVAVVAALSMHARARALLVGLLASYTAFLLLPGIFATPDLATAPPFPLLFLEWHYASVVSTGDRLASGLKLFSEVIPPYGVLVPTLLGAWERAHGLLTWGAHIQLVHVMNALFVCAGLAAAVKWFRRVPGVVIALLALLPWVSSFHPSTLFPNQSAFRFLGLPLAVLALSWLSEQPRARWGVGFGVVTGALVIFNPETAVASVAGFFVFLVLRVESFRELVRTGAQLASAALLPIGAWVLFYRWSFDAWPFPSTASSAFDLVLRFSGGYGGFPLQKVFIAVLVLAHAVFSVVVAFARRRSTRRGAIRAALGTTLIVWFAYYANRSSAGNLWSYLFLYSFLLDTWLHPLSLRAAFRHARRGHLAARTACFVLIFAVPAITENVIAAQRVLEEGFSGQPPEGTTEVVSGVLLPTAVAHALREKAEYVARTPDSFYVTTNGYTIPLLLGRFPESPFGDVFAESKTPADTKRLEAFIRERAPARLLFDDPESMLTSTSPQQRYFERVRASFADSYEVEGTASGWLVLRKVR
jgi:hypothetical protein